MRGNANNPPANDGDESEYMNYIFWFGCQENSGVSANSTIAVEFFKEMKRVANPADGTVELPNDMTYWKPGDGGNIVHRVDFPLRLAFKDWVP